jgi:hypothetical protein
VTAVVDGYVGLVLAPLWKSPSIMSQYVPAGSPVANVLDRVVVSLFSAIQPRVPRLKAIRFTPSSNQLASGAFPTKLCQPTMFRARARSAPRPCS